MNVRMVLQVLAPGVKHADEADLGVEMLRIGGDRAQRLGRRPEKNGVDRSLVLERDFGGGRRQGEDDVEIRHRQQIGLARREPILRRRALALWAIACPREGGGRLRHEL
jgi:hypothetical protein